MKIERVKNLPSGSSPPVRGTPTTEKRPRALCRFIPACAGNTLPTPGASVRAAVHPRLCGEHGNGTIAQPQRGGSSPPVRGTRLSQPPATRLNRFIPACAGNTLPHGLPWNTTAVHPRLCGEHDDKRHTCLPPSGSSPPVRGTLLIIWPAPRRYRFIPACAGNTIRPEPRSSTKTVHPRLCGEH